MELTLTKSEVRDFTRRNKTAMGMHSVATEDYLGCRCCILNGLLSPGFVLAEQAIEKELKCILLLLDRDVNLKSFPNHQIEPIIQKIQEIEDLGLTRFQALGRRLSEIYELSRYPDNRLKERITSWSMNGGDIVEIDEMFFHLNEVLPLPDEVKYRSGIYVKLLERQDVTDLVYKWGKLGNVSFNDKKPILEERYIEVKKHLYPGQ